MAKASFFELIILQILLSGSLSLGHVIPTPNLLKMAELGRKTVVSQEKQYMPYSHPKSPEERPKEALQERNKLHLKSPDSSIFTPEFQFLFIDTNVMEEENESSGLVFRDATPSVSLMKNLESNVLLDPNSDIVDLENKEREKSRIMTGMIDGMAITHEHPHQVVTTKLRHQKNPPPPSSVKDYVDLHRNLTTGATKIPFADEDHDHQQQGNKVLGISTEAQPEVFVIFDYANTLRFNKNNTAIVDYLNVYFRAVNNRYATFNEPKIAFRISGVIAVSSKKAQPFLEKYKLRDGGYDINLVMESLAGWIYGKLRQLPKHDIAHLLTGEILKTKDMGGKYVDSISGLAFLKGACWISSKTKKSLAVSIAQDIDGIWDGVFTTAHELAHNLGASHDDTLKCPWSDGYIMSYSGWGTRNKFYFSECSIKAMDQFVRSSEGSCLLTSAQSSVATYNVDNTGDRLDMTTLCKKYTKNSLAYVDTDVSPSDLCKNLICRYPDGKDGYHVVRINHPPGDNVSCGNSSGRCKNGDCIS